MYSYIYQVFFVHFLEAFNFSEIYSKTEEAMIGFKPLTSFSLIIYYSTIGDEKEREEFWTLSLTSCVNTKTAQ
jgi:hypothetical protein